VSIFSKEKMSRNENPLGRGGEEVTASVSGMERGVKKAWEVGSLYL
jgi:hypothetical protein